jgi:hypothetical protein
MTTNSPAKRPSGLDEVILICRYLEILDRLLRTPEPDGRIFNTLIDL